MYHVWHDYGDGVWEECDTYNTYHEAWLDVEQFQTEYTDSLLRARSKIQSSLGRRREYQRKIDRLKELS